MFSQAISTVASELAEWQVHATSLDGGCLFLRNAGGLVLSNDPLAGEHLDPEGPPVPGVLVEGVRTDTVVSEADTVTITVWAGDRMHDVRVDADASVQARVAVPFARDWPQPYATCYHCGDSYVPHTDNKRHAEMGCRRPDQRN